MRIIAVVAGAIGVVLILGVTLGLARYSVIRLTPAATGKGSRRPARPVLLCNPWAGAGRSSVSAWWIWRRISVSRWSSSSAASISKRSRAMPSPVGRTVSAWQAVTDHKPWSPRSPPNTICRSFASPPAPGTTSPSTSVSIATTRSRRWTRSGKLGVFAISTKTGSQSARLVTLAALGLPDISRYWW